MLFFFFKQKTAYEIYQCDWSSDVCSSDLWSIHTERERQLFHALDHQPDGVVSVVFDATDRIDRKSVV